MDKPIYRSSNLCYYPICPKKFYLSTLHDQQTTTAMRDGLLLEGYLFGFKKDSERSQFELEGRRYNKDGTLRKMTPAQLETLDRIKAKANKINEIYQFEGEPFVKMIVDFPDFKLRGEADFIGSFIHNGKRTEKCIVDVKFTSNIDRIWNYKTTKKEFFQSVMYCFLELTTREDFDTFIYFKHNEPLPFYYLIIENNDYENPLHKLIKINITSNDLIWLWDKIQQIHKAEKLGYQANDIDENCLGISSYQSRCPYLQYCEEGRAKINFEHELDFSLLNDG